MTRKARIASRSPIQAVATTRRRPPPPARAAKLRVMKLARNVTPRWSASASKSVPLGAVGEPACPAVLFMVAGGLPAELRPCFGRPQKAPRGRASGYLSWGARAPRLLRPHPEEPAFATRRQASRRMRAADVAPLAFLAHGSRRAAARRSSP